MKHLNVFVREIGGEYSKKLLLRNIDTKTQHITYSLPQTKYFSMGFPQTLVLSPGMSYLLDVTFRPIELVSHIDTDCI